MSAMFWKCGAEPRDWWLKADKPANGTTLQALLSFVILSERHLGQPEGRRSLEGKSSFHDNLLASLGWLSGLDTRNPSVDN